MTEFVRRASGQDPFVTSSVRILEKVRENPEGDPDLQAVANVLKWTLLELEARGVFGSE
jgi:hypothetical protein